MHSMKGNYPLEGADTTAQLQQLMVATIGTLCHLLQQMKMTNGKIRITEI